MGTQRETNKNDYIYTTITLYGHMCYASLGRNESKVGHG